MPWGISEKYKVIFIHVPKTAGCAICDLLVPAMSIQSNHATISEIEKWYRVSPNSPRASGVPFEQYRPFAVIRNPYDRFVLGYFYERGRLVFRSKEEGAVKALIDGGIITSLRTQASWINETCRLLKYENLETELNSFFNETGIPLDARDMKIIHAPEAGTNLDGCYTSDLRKTVRKIYDVDFKIWEQLG